MIRAFLLRLLGDIFRTQAVKLVLIELLAMLRQRAAETTNTLDDEALDFVEAVVLSDEVADEVTAKLNKVALGK